MENKPAETQEAPLTTDPILVQTIVDILSRDLEVVKNLLKSKNIMEVVEH